MKGDISGRRRAYALAMKALMGISVILTASLVAFLLIYVLAKGLPHITWQLLSTKPSYLSDTVLRVFRTKNNTRLKNERR